MTAKTPHQVIADELAWIKAEAQTLPPAGQAALAEALAEPYPALVATSLFKLLRGHALPASWEPHITNLLEFSR